MNIAKPLRRKHIQFGTITVNPTDTPSTLRELATTLEHDARRYDAASIMRPHFTYIAEGHRDTASRLRAEADRREQSGA